MKLVTTIGLMDIEDAKAKLKRIKKYLRIENVKTRIVPSDFNTFIWIEENASNIVMSKISECFKHQWEHEWDFLVAKVDKYYEEKRLKSKTINITPPKFL